MGYDGVDAWLARQPAPRRAVIARLGGATDPIIRPVLERAAKRAALREASALQVASDARRRRAEESAHGG